MWDLRDIVMNIGILDILDMLIVAYAFYKIYMLIKETRAQQLVKGLIILFAATKISELLQLHVVNWILKNTMTVGVIALLIVFQPEMRRALEYIGRTKFFVKNAELNKEKQERVIEEIIEATYSLSRQKIGALMIIEGETGINEIIQTGTQIGGKVTRQLLINIFIPNTPLHDGALVIRNTVIEAAACFLPLTENKNLSKELGTRHRAGLGVSEMSDCISVIVSEETGGVSIAKNGQIYRSVGREYLRHVLESAMLTEEKNKRIFDKEKIIPKGWFSK